MNSERGKPWENPCCVETQKGRGIPETLKVPGARTVKTWGK